MPAFAQRIEAPRAANKRRRSSYLCAAPSPARKQPRTSTAASPSAIKSSRITQQDKSSKPYSSMKDTIESQINASLDSWLADLKTIPLIISETQPLDPCSTYIYMQLDLDDPTSYVAVSLPPSLVAQIMALPPPRSTSEPSTMKEDTDSMSSLSMLLSQIDTKTSSSLPTPPQTPPRMAV
ncbi:hypothetical protein EG327_010208 [Venturia inaequalis]|uniref:Uncharacterized protein n=1 Tax=Venturia inaequalis TaxID=5025 RepID=A0A8H3UJX7_VENIN|nr:hypothetical protein EG327_010208 [Venturia inaequalis]